MVMTDPGVDVPKRLLIAVSRNCTCEPDANGIVSESCPCHKMLDDQEVVKHLIFMESQRLRLLRGEGVDDVEGS